MDYGVKPKIQKKNHFRRKGVTLIELILVIAIFLIISASAYPFGSSFIRRNQLKNTTNEIVSSLRTAQINAMSGKEDRRWGVNTTATQITMYAEGDGTYDQVFEVASAVNVTAQSVIFNNITGNPDSTATIAVSNSLGETNTVTVNEVGIVNVN
jgi:prepilin-type N-terminal cleavage/methylation domain-containing protein